ncbi:MAG: DEAD/DEAH box helicase [Burkholderiales bacterium]
MPDLARAVADHGYTQPTPVQIQAIPVILEGCDVLAGAQTGTGKTAGFTLPLLQRLMENPPEPGTCPVRALIVTPTRELAAQIEESVHTYGKYLPLRSTVVFGGVGIAPQIDALKAGVDILVATPGRLLDHANEQTVDLSQVEILVLDEADRMLDMGFIHDVKRILALLPAQRQNLLFSATFSDEIRELADGLLTKPVMVEVARRNAESELVAQRVHPVGQDRKRALLAHLVKTGDWKQVLVFTRTKHGANRLAHQLGRSGISATAIHGNKSQGARTKALADFKAGAVRVLVATDLAARGLDIEELPHVVNYDLPHVAEDYVHRIGRTGRAGSTGEAISLVSPEEKPLLTEIEKLLRRTVDQTVIPGFEPGTEPPARPLQEGQQAQPQHVRRPNEGGQNAALEGGEGKESTEGREGRGRRRNRGRNRNRDGSNGGAPREMQAGGAVADGAVVAPPPPRQEAPRNDRGQANRNNGGHRQEASREDRDNRGNRDTPNRNQRNLPRDDDFGNRIAPVKHSNSIRARIASGDIDEALDNIGNRVPSPSKNQRNFDTEDEINFNVAAPALPSVFDDDERQPESNAGQMFPSSAGFMTVARPRRGNGGAGRNSGNGGNRGGRVHRGNRGNAGDGNKAGIGAASGSGERGNGSGNGNARNRNGKRRRGQPQRQGSGQGQPQGQSPGQGQPRQGQQRRGQRQPQRGLASSSNAGRPDNKPQ